jgi:hypothetical protein
LPVDGENLEKEAVQMERMIWYQKVPVSGSLNHDEGGRPALDLDAAIAWATRSPTALHGVVEVRPVREGTL